jgi:prephenate dehydratase
MRVGFLGPSGTFTEEASRKYFAGRDVSGWQDYLSILDVMEAVQTGEVDYGVVPIENSLEGAVNQTLDGLSQFAELFVAAEIVLPIEQNLLTNAGTRLGDIREIWSHPQALAQCRSFIRSLGVPVKTRDSTAAAAAEVAASGRQDVAAIGNRFAATRFNMQILQENLQDTTENHTRFVVVGGAAEEREDAVKTMLLLTLAEERAGALVHVLNVFSAVDLNLTRIESRPTRRGLGTYQFFIDVAAGAQTEAVQSAVSIIETFGHQVRILGSVANVHIPATNATK